MSWLKYNHTLSNLFIRIQIDLSKFSQDNAFSLYHTCYFLKHVLDAGA